MTFSSSSFRASLGTIFSAALCSAESVMPINCVSARKSPDAALLTNCFSAASSLVICFRLPFSLMTTISRSARNKVVATFRVPFGRPFGLPDFPR